MNIGSIEIEQPIALAPMEDVTDAAFRLVCKRLGADIVYTEFTSCEALIRDIPRAIKKIRITDEERPIAIQLFGGVEESMEEATKRATDFGPDFIDINCGCWVKNHVSRGEGAALLKDLLHFERIVASTVKATKLPVTVKTRLGWDAKSIVILDVAKMVEQAGAKAITIHCRTRNQAHRGEADWHWLEKIKKVVSIPVIGNGDITTPGDVKRMFETGCDGVMIGRGAMTNPWIFQQAKYFLKNGQYLPEPTLREKIELCIEHLKLSVQLKGLRDGVIPFRKYYVGYLNGVPNVAKLRSDLMQLVDLEKIIERLLDFSKMHPSTTH
ncbi:MAG: tRNA dihydrouridine synthase DusB [Candidatus Omnitrophica bacterium]|nr:tRNA dihydrouridine synthase DusB [Candidatus Omnitrophota bacterium]